MSSSPSLVDTHAHLDDPRLAGDLDAVLARASAAGVEHVIAIGTTADSSRSTLEIARRHRPVRACVGIQPNHVAEARPGDWPLVEALARAGGPLVVGLGETGLDRHWDYTPFDQQQDSFALHLGLALELDLPVVIHCRNCEADVVAQLRGLPRPVRGVLHSFTGTWDQARAFLDLGLDLSIAGMVTFPNRSLDALRDAAARIPDDRLLVETDSPYLSPVPHRGQTNEPARVASTAAFLAELRGASLEELAESTTRNARRLFRLADPASEGPTASIAGR